MDDKGSARKRGKVRFALRILSFLIGIVIAGKIALTKTAYASMLGETAYNHRTEFRLKKSVFSFAFQSLALFVLVPL